VIPALLGRELGAGVLGDKIPERALLTLELARLVAGLHPLGDLVDGVFLFSLGTVLDRMYGHWAPRLLERVFLVLAIVGYEMWKLAGLVVQRDLT
jgi:hypothetical protein